MSVNKVILIGNLGKDPEVRYTPSGSAICAITLATSRQWKDKQSGEKVEETEWHRVVFFDRLAEVVGEHCAKGKPIYVEGRLKTRKWTDKDGVEKYTTEILAENMKLLGGRDRDDGQGNGNRGSDAPAQRGSQGRQQGSGNGGGGGYGNSQPPTQRQPARQQQKSSTGFDDMDDDIPF